jgi:copper resistance protein B
MSTSSTAHTILSPRIVTLYAALILGAVALGGSPAHAQTHSTSHDEQSAPGDGEQTASGQTGGPEDGTAMDHGQMNHAGMGADKASAAQPRPYVQPITDADRAAAFPDVAGHGVQDTAINHFVLLDQFEWQDAEGGAQNWDAKAWIGTNLNRAWLRTEGEREDDRTDAAFAEALYGRAISPWWDLVAGVRQDFRPGPSRTWGAIGVQGLAPYQFDIEATVYIGESTRTHARFEVEYELLLSNRLILQPQLEAELFAESDPARGIGSGLSTVEFGLRLRYEVRREFAPYLGVVWSRKLGDTADFARAEGEGVEDTRLVGGIRFWF